MATDSLILLREIGLRMQADLIKSKKTHIVCGPISSGGLGSLKRNLKLFNAVVETLSAGGYPIWSQLQFEDEIIFAKELWLKDHPGEYCQPILDICYELVFEPRQLRVGHFIPGRQAEGIKRSIGTSWEYAKIMSQGGKCLDVDPGLITFLLEDLFPAESISA